ncbi:MAG: hypothetical protein WC511_02385 [Candidatus Pacearchaeota archaeon]
MPTKTYTLAQVLNVTTGRLLTNMLDVRDLLGFLTRDGYICDLGCVVVAPHCRKVIFKKFPFLKKGMKEKLKVLDKALTDLICDTQVNRSKAIDRWVENLESQWPKCYTFSDSDYIG